MKLGKALLIADPQIDFFPGGALGIKDGDKILPVVNAYIRSFAARQLPVFVTRDWHPKKTKHFKAYGGVWPRHCVRDTKGAVFHPGLKLPKEAIILSKGMDPEKDSYSAFHAVDQNHKELHHLLQIFGVTELYVGGLATDYCVKHSVLDALKYGYKAHVLLDAAKGVNLKPQDSDDAIRQMAAAGAKMTTFYGLFPAGRKTRVKKKSSPLKR
ncbi:MAG: isochorismatase family protein [Candidatus Omnitrophica bacterium]|nr:isochorismatase family protein [Candidatus Omnitrophota bacterium]MDD5573880.1 isochorismatase family protein [Candidatus Omnitrophota bacterium]